MENELEKILDKYFKDEKTKYYHPWDSIFDEQFIRWSYHQHKRNEILIELGSNNGDVAVKVFTDANELEQFIKLIINH
jgi:hypothetical protein